MTRPENSRLNYNLLAMLFIIAIAAVLRFWELRWGLPNALHSYSYHPDEFLIIGASFIAVFLNRSINPGLYNYPSLFIYLCALAMAVTTGYGMKATGSSIYLIARVMSAAMGVAAVAVTYWAGKTLFNRTAGLIAAILICIAPLHVQHSHYGTVDVPSTLLVASALGFAGLMLKRGSWKDYIFAGVMTGLAAGTKYNAGIVVFSAIAAHFLRSRINWDSIKSGKFWAMIGCVLAAFVISTPGSVLYFNEFYGGLKYEMAHTSTGHGLVFAGTGNGFLYTFTSSLWHGLGAALAITFALALIWSIWKRDKSALVIIAFILPYYILISHSQVRFARYTIPMFPAIAALCGWFIWSLFKELSTTKYTRYRYALVAAFAFLIAATTAYTCQLNGLFSKADPRDAAARWVFAHVPKGSSIGVIEVPWFYSPPLSNSFGFGALQQRLEEAEKTPYNITIFANCTTVGCWWNGANSPRWIITSDYETHDALRLRNNKSISEDDKKQVERVLTDISLIRQHYNKRVKFKCSDLTNLPHDMSYPCTVITVYERKQ